MSPIRIIILIVAVVAAGAAAFLVNGLSNDTPQIVERRVVEEVQVATTKVLVASERLEVGQLISPEALRWADWPEDGISPDFLTQETHPDAMSEAAGWVVRTPIFANEPILPQKVVRKGETGYMAALLPGGKRAISVEISTETASSGFILPNDRVDVLLTREGDLGPVTRTIIENVRVLAIDQDVRQNANGTAVGSTALLELVPADAELMTLAARVGEISLALRSLSDALASGDLVESRPELIDGGDADLIRVFRNGQATSSTVGG